MKLPAITHRQEVILKLLYRYRFLNRKQLQIMLKHKNKSLVLIWLKDLREKDYVQWIYSYDLDEKAKPAIYYLSLNGIRYLKSTNEYPAEAIKKRYRESERSQRFIDTSMLLADCSINFRTNSNTINTYITTQADYAHGAHEFNFLVESYSNVKPQLIIKLENTKDGRTKNYLLEVFETCLPQYSLRKRLKQYVKFIDEGYWVGDRDDPEPIILLVFPTKELRVYARRKIREFLGDSVNSEDIHIWITTLEKLKTHGITAEIWDEIEAPTY
jgi:hypothetical protein